MSELSSFDNLQDIKSVLTDKEQRAILASRERTLERLEKSWLAACERLAEFTADKSRDEILRRTHTATTQFEGAASTYYSLWPNCGLGDVVLLDSSELAIRDARANTATELDPRSPAYTNKQLFHLAEHLDTLVVARSDSE